MIFLLIWWDTRSLRTACRWLLAVADEMNRFDDDAKRHGVIGSQGTT